MLMATWQVHLHKQLHMEMIVEKLATLRSFNFSGHDQSGFPFQQRRFFAFYELRTFDTCLGR